MSLWIYTHVALGTRPLLGSSEREKRSCAESNRGLRNSKLSKSETFGLTVILQDLLKIRLDDNINKHKRVH